MGSLDAVCKSHCAPSRRGPRAGSRRRQPARGFRPTQGCAPVQLFAPTKYLVSRAPCTPARQADKQTSRHADKQTDEQTDRPRLRQTIAGRPGDNDECVTASHHTAGALARPSGPTYKSCPPSPLKFPPPPGCSHPPPPPLPAPRSGGCGGTRRPRRSYRGASGTALGIPTVRLLQTSQELRPPLSGASLGRVPLPGMSSQVYSSL